jgi:hypothetical protein
MWQRIEARLALLELLTEGKLPRRKAQEETHRWLAQLPWTRVTRRRGEIDLVPERTADLVALLDRIWPGWAEVRGELEAAGLPPTPTGWQALEDRCRGRALPSLPSRLNRHTAAALAGPHAKVRVTPDRVSVLGDVEIVDDGLVRLRLPAGLVAILRDERIELDPWMALLGEIGFPERPLLDGLRFEGTVRAVLLVENLGAWRDMPRPEGWLLAHVPGWDTRGVGLLLEALPSCPVVHFGDLDPDGVKIHRHLAASIPELGWLVPQFWGERVESHGQTGAWPEELDLEGTPELVRELARRDLWLEQEVIALDARLVGVMEGLIQA